MHDCQQLGPRTKPLWKELQGFISVLVIIMMVPPAVSFEISKEDKNATATKKVYLF